MAEKKGDPEYSIKFVRNTMRFVSVESTMISWRGSDGKAAVELLAADGEQLYSGHDEHCEEVGQL